MSFAIDDFVETIKGTGVERTDIKRAVAAFGVTEAACCDDCGGEWNGGFLLEMKSGEFLFLTGWCDYTGWGCQDGTEKFVFDSLPELSALDPGKEWETSLPDIQRYIETDENSHAPD
jgi:hypothetical protein